MDIGILPIETEGDYAWAISEIAAYFDNLPTAGTPAALRFDGLAAVIEAYEARHWPVEATESRGDNGSRLGATWS